MGFIQDAVREISKVSKSGKRLKNEDMIRSLAPNDSRGHRLPVVFGNNEFFLTKNGAWTGFAVPNRPWGFLDEQSRQNYYHAANSIFARIFPSDKESSGHLKVTNRVYTADEWEASLLERYKGTASDTFAMYVNASRQEIEQREFFERECYLFTRLGSRGTQNGLLDAVRSIAETVLVGAGMDDCQPDEKEVTFWSTQASSAVDTLSNSWLAAEPIHRRRLEWVTRHMDAPGLPTPDVAPADEEEWGAGAWRTTLGSYTEVVNLGVSGKNRYKCVKFDAPTGDGITYAAFLPLSIIPLGVHYERNWLHHASSLNFPVDVDLRFEIIDPDRAESILEKPITDAEAQEEEDAEAGVRPDDTTALQSQGLRDAKTSVRMNRESITHWQCVFSVYDTDKDELLSKVNKLIKHYKDIQFELVCPPVDQRELFYQAFPGSNIIIDSWMHRTDTSYLAAAQPWLTSSVGDRDDAHGLYQGYTIVRDANGTQQKGVPVFYDLQNVVDDEGKAPTEVVCGFPGSGKSVSRGLKVVHEDGLRGITQFIWDPKGDFLPLKRYARQMRLDPDKVKLVDLYNSSDSVSLDPFGIAEVDPSKNIDERVSSATDILENLLYAQVKDARYGLQYSQIISQSVSAVVSREKQGGPGASMMGVLDILREIRDGNFESLNSEDSGHVSDQRKLEWSDLAQSMVQYLNTVKEDTLGRLLFRDPAQSGSMKVSQGDMVIFIAIKMKTTEIGADPDKATIISDVISALMTDYIRSLLFVLPDEVVKSMVFDEWHVIKKTKRAEALVDWLRRMGRSKRCMVKQMSQSAKDFDGGSLSTVWCGYVETVDEAHASCDLLGIERSPSNVAMLMNLTAGQFLFRDVHKRVAHVRVDIWDDWLLEKFNTQAAAKAKIAEDLARQGELAGAGV